MLSLLRRLWRYLTGDTLIDEYCAPRPLSFDDASEPDEPLIDDLMSPRWLTKAELAAASAEHLEREQRRRAAWQKFGTDNPDLVELGDKVVAYPPKVDEEDAQDWVTAELERRTGGITRHPMDLTRYPTPPSEQDLAAREYVNREIESTYGSGANASPVARGYFTHGMSMRYLGELLDRARRKDPTLTDEDLMALRSRGLI